VLYLLNGGYHFHAYTGLVEDLSNSQLIPELIVVGLGRGDEQSYRRQMRPDFGKNSDGEAEQFLRFLETELKPQLRQQYRMADYEILMGQSIGGVFAIYSLFTQPESFNSYISVSPMLWWQEHKLEAEAAKFLKQLGAPKKNLYLSMANEKRLGVYGLVEQLERARNQWLGWDFKRYPEENSQSIGLVAARAALRDLFKGWYLSYDELAGFKGFEEVSEHYRTLLKRFNLHQAIPLFSFQALAHQYRSSAREEESGLMYLQTMQHMPSSASRLRHHLAELEIKNKSYDKALELIRESHTVNPHDYQVPRLLAKIELARGDKTKAREYAQEALLLAEKLQLRPWQLRALAAELAQLASE
ncbi:MAG: alpha/beta hydrolase-fold protein, partial [Cellvibrionaceae bacterium]|nr:alpha/beta hydrolase-fold protein [Cellvibrionaceae bacterium]